MKNETYETPLVEIIEVEVEKGFAASDGMGMGGNDAAGAPGMRGDWDDIF